MTEASSFRYFTSAHHSVEDGQLAHAARYAIENLSSREIFGSHRRKVRDDTPEDSLAFQQCKKDMFDLF